MFKLITYILLWAFYSLDSVMSPDILASSFILTYSISTIFYSAGFMCDLLELAFKGPNKYYKGFAWFFIILGILVLYPVMLPILGKSVGQKILEYKIASCTLYTLNPSQHVWFTLIFPATLFLFMIKDRKKGE